MRRGTEFHATDRRELFTVERDEIFIGFVEQEGEVWRAFDVEMGLVDPACSSREEAAQECWIANAAKPQIRFDRVMTAVQRTRAVHAAQRLVNAFKLEG